MLNEQKLKQIQALVKTATVLNEQEKVEWMALIELMNDKQITELEEILQQPKPVPVVPTPPVEVRMPSAPINSSSLSHISNLPSQFSDQAPSLATSPSTAPQAAPPLTPPHNLPIAPSVVEPPVVEPPLAPPVPIEPILPARRFNEAVDPTPVSNETPMPPATPPVVATPMPPVDSQGMQVSEAEVISMPPVDGPGTISMYVPVLKLENFDDIAKLTVGALHAENRESFHKKIGDLASQYGYFHVVTSFEQSPLYKEYLNYGQQMLSGNKENLKLSQEEFEFITDLLLSLKVNRF